MIRLTIGLFLVCLATCCDAQNTAKEKAVMAYYSGFERKDWKAVADQLADGFTFSSPNNDDHISIGKFKEKCWVSAKYVKKVDYIKMLEKGDDLMLQVRITTTDGSVVRNVDVFNFNGRGKIKSIEVFFGTGAKYPGNKH